MKSRFTKVFSIALAALMTVSIGSTSLASSYTVNRGDNLWKIAKEQLGDGSRYQEIYDANKAQIKDPNLIQIGQVLEIPDGITTVKTEDTTSNNTSENTSENTEVSTELKAPVTIVYTNDIHSYIANTVTVGEGEDAKEESGLRYSKISQLVKDMEASGKNVILVDAGDEVQGSSYGSFDKGDTIIELMNAAGYDLAVPGNHDYDYGMDKFFSNVASADFPYISANFRSLETGNTVLDNVKIFDLNGTKVAFVGATTPLTRTSSTPKYFQNDIGEYIYDFDGSQNASALYESIQNAVNAVRAEVDYVVAVGHLGVEQSAQDAGISSINVIANTTGIDAFVDGHSHTFMEGDMVNNKDGKPVVLTQTGAYLNAIGIMEIDASGNISTKLIDEYPSSDPEVAAIEDAYINEVRQSLKDKVASVDFNLSVMDPEVENRRLIRAQEMNIGDFNADAYYWYFNEKMGIDCDIAIANGGGIRANVMAGDIIKQNILDVVPFGNMICLMEATGAQIIDALENGVISIGEWDEEWDSPKEFGGFLQVAGLKYTIDAGIPTSVESTNDGDFIGVKGDYRVKDVMVYNKAAGVYEPIDKDRTYRIGGIDYLLKNGGNGLTMFAGNKEVVEYVGQEVEILTSYFESFTKEGEYSKITTQGSPLSAYKDYLIDYENPFGAGRINIINLAY